MASRPRGTKAARSNDAGPAPRGLEEAGGGTKLQSAWSAAAVPSGESSGQAPLGDAGCCADLEKAGGGLVTDHGLDDALDDQVHHAAAPDTPEGSSREAAPQETSKKMRHAQVKSKEGRPRCRAKPGGWRAGPRCWRSRRRWRSRGAGAPPLQEGRAGANGAWNSAAGWLTLLHCGGSHAICWLLRLLSSGAVTLRPKTAL